MIQNWSIRSRSHHCALSSRPFAEGEVFHTAIYFDPETGGYLRRDVALDSWKEELAQRTPVAYWRTTYSPQIVEQRPEVTSKESAMALLQRFIEEDEPQTEDARYILALMLERKRILSPTAAKETEQGRMLFYENKKTSEVFMIRDPELRLDELAQMQDEVAMLLGFGGPAAEAARTAGMKFTPDGKLVKAGASDTPASIEPPPPPEVGPESASAPEETAPAEPDPNDQPPQETPPGEPIPDKAPAKDAEPDETARE